jgi:pilus assembly protein CpaF
MGSETALLARVRDRLAAAGDAPPSRAAVAAAVRREARLVAPGTVLASTDELRSEYVGAGRLEPLLASDGVTDVVVNGPHDVFVDRGRGLEPAGIRFTDDRELRRLAVRLATSAGRRLDDAAPCADVQLSGGVRMHAVLPPISRFVCLSLRVPRAAPMPLHEWVAGTSMPAAGASLLERVIAARCSFVVTGGVGTGKTTLLATLLGLVDPRERIVVVEDCAELRPAHPHVVRLAARPPNIEGAGAIGLRVLVREALRMRPDRLVVGEVRGGECVDLLAALNVGHDGGAGTLHANSPADVPARVEALCTAGGLSREAAHSQLAAGLRLVIHLRRAAGGARRLDSVGVVCRGADGFVEVASAVRVRGGEMVDGPARRELDRMLDRDVSSEAS